MKIVLQRVNSARVEAEGNITGNIKKGYVAFLGISKGDNKEIIKKAADKIFRLRIFADENGKTNLSASDVNGEILIISQFTLMAELNSNRPSFSNAAEPKAAKELYEYFIECCKEKFFKVASGKFAAHMHVYCENDGPFTLFVEEGLR